MTMYPTTQASTRPYASGVKISGGDEWQARHDAIFAKAYDLNAPAEVASRETFAASAKGRLSAAIRTIEQTPKFAAKGAELHGLYCRSVQMSHQPMSREVGGAFVAILSGIDSDVAWAALEAVGELLMARVA